MTGKLIRDGLLFFATIDPIATVVIFAALTASLGTVERRRIAIQAIMYSTAILLASMVLGQLVLAGLGIRLISLQVAGGIILFLFGLQMIFGDKLLKERDPAEPGHHVAVFPLAVPTIASPGAIMAVIVATDNDLHTIGQQAVSAAVLLAVLGLTLGMMLLADPIFRRLGSHGSEILVRVMGMLLAALSVEFVMEALGVARWIEHAP